jgi:3-dehydroquinate synthase
MAETITIQTRFGKYGVTVGRGLDYGALARGVIPAHKAVIISDDNVFPLYGESVIKSFRDSGYETAFYILNHGEMSKSMETVSALLNALAGENLTRGDILIALGGGVVGDITGFTAAVYLRGIAYFQLPTTILAAVDSSVGGKTGVDLPTGKNLAGAFHPPAGVFCDVNTFDTLPRAVFSDGMAEAVKHGMIADRELFEKINDMPPEEMVLRNVRIKAVVVEEDELEQGKRKLLNFGHTVGHAIETASHYTILHGAAVAAGMAIVTRACEKMGLTEEPCLDALLKKLEYFNLPTGCAFSARELAEAARRDKKRTGDEISLVIPKSIGRAELYALPVVELEGFIGRGI